MVGKNRIRTNSIRNIRRSFARFLSLLVISALGVFVFAGLSATKPDMIETLDKYLDKNDVYDVKIISSMGLTDDDLEALRETEGVRELYGEYYQDILIRSEDSESVVRAASLPEKLNNLTLLDGRMPEKADEIVVEELLLSELDKQIGDTLELSDDAFVNQKVTIVGTVESPLYYGNPTTNGSRGNTTLGSGKVNYYAYTPADNFDRDYYTEIYLTVEDAAGYRTSSDGYVQTVEAVKDKIDEIRSDREEARYQGIRDEAQQEIDDAKAEADEKLADAEAELEDAKSQLDDGKTKLEDAKTQLADARTQLEDAATQISDGEEELAAKKQEYEDGAAKLETAASEISANEEKLNQLKAGLDEKAPVLEAAKTQLDVTEAQLAEAETQLSEAEGRLSAAEAQISAGEQQISEAEAQISEKETQLAAVKQLIDAGLADEQTIAVYEAGIAALSEAKTQLDAQKSVLETSKAQYDASKAQYETSKAAYEQGMSAYEQGQSEYEQGKAQYDTLYAQYEAGMTALSKAKAQYESGAAALSEGAAAISSAEQQLADAKASYAEGLADYQSGQTEYDENAALYEENLQKYEDGQKEYDDKKAEADQKIADAEAELDDLEYPEWYIYDRMDDSLYSSYLDDAGSVGNLSALFPVVFFLVAVLVSLISMNRMVEDDRLEIGTMKSLGFERKHIITKYVTFSLSATVLGGIIGAALGLYIIPSLIFGIYKILFAVPDFQILPEWKTTILGFIITVICVVGTGILTANQVLREKPSELMRPKAPKNGRRVFLEKIGFIWKRISFSQKVTVRNLFRYKKRVLVTIGGIAGCTALMLCGFGIRDSIMDIPTLQYGKVYLFEGMAYASGLDEEDAAPLSDIFGNDEIACYSDVERLSVMIGDTEGYIFAAETADDLEKVVHLADKDSGEEFTPETGKVIITEKLASLEGLKAGDTITFTDNNQVKYNYEIQAVAENYVEHLIFMDQETLEQFSSYSPNMVYFSFEDYDSMSAAEKETFKDSLSKELLANDEILNVTYKDDLIENIENMLNSLNRVVLILIVLAALLSFVVLYNLANINIHERKREIATLKVLGFYDREVDSYITRETFVLTLVGIAIGLVIGIFLTHAVVATVEIEKCRFVNRIKPVSYLYASLFSAAFTIIVNFITHFSLKRIDMIDSLKSVE